MPKQAFANKVANGDIDARPILALLDGLTSEEISRLAVDIIRENRQWLNLAQSLFEQLEMSEKDGTTKQILDDLKREYRLAMLELKIQHELVRLIVDVLGYLPELPEDGAIQ